jgi:small subunit ribosomal protein S17
MANEPSTNSAEPAPTEVSHTKRRTLRGIVTSTAMDKTVVVTVTRRVRARRFHKFVQRRVKYKAHDENNSCEMGDRVEMIESRPYSKTKRWRVTRTIERAQVGAGDALVGGPGGPDGLEAEGLT